MPAVDDPFGIAASLPGQIADLRRQIKDLSTNNTQAASIAAAVLKASVVTPVTAVATSSSTAIPYGLTATMVVPAGATRCFYTATATVYAGSSGQFDLTSYIVAPSSGSFGYIGSGTAPFAASGISTAVGFLTGLIPGSTLSFTASIGAGHTGTITLVDARMQALAVFQP